MGDKIIIIGGIAAGTSAAAKIRRKNEEAEIVLYEMDRYISYGTCGLPYYVSGKIKSLGKILINTTQLFEKRFNLKVKTRHEVTMIDPGANKIQVRNLETEEKFEDKFDKLIITTGSIPIKLRFDGYDSPNVFVLKTIDDAIDIKKYLEKLDREEKEEKNAVIIGGGFVGLELMDAFLERDYKVSVIEKASQILPMFDIEIISYLENYLIDAGVSIYKEDEVKDLNFSEDKIISSISTLKERELASDIVFFGIGTRPNVKLAENCGIKLGISGAIEVDEYMRTNFSNIYAAGDCCECKNLITEGHRSYLLASIANRQGRTAGYNAAGGEDKFTGSVVTSIIKVADIAIAKTGLSISEARALNIQFDFIELHRLSHAGYYPGADMMHMIMVFEKNTGKILGFQAIGKSGVDKKTDIISIAIKENLAIWDLANLDLGYQPAYGSAKDPINILGMIGENLKKGEVKFIGIDQLKDKIKNNEEISILDVRTQREYDKAHIEGAVLIPIDDLRDNLSKLDKNSDIVIYCRTGYRAYVAYKILENTGFKNIQLLNGSYLSWQRKI